MATLAIQYNIGFTIIVSATGETPATSCSLNFTTSTCYLPNLKHSAFQLVLRGFMILFIIFDGTAIMPIFAVMLVHQQVSLLLESLLPRGVALQFEGSALRLMYVDIFAFKNVSSHVCVSLFCSFCRQPLQLVHHFFNGKPPSPISNDCKSWKSGS